MKEVSLKKSASERKADKEMQGANIGMPYEEDGGVTLHLEHHHLEKMGLGDSLKSGDKFHMKGHGHVESSESRSGKDGERHSARLRLTHAGVEQDPRHMGDGRVADKAELRGELDKAYENAEKRSEAEETTK